MEDYSLNLQKCNEYIVNLEEERRKIQVFQRELPLCLDLVTQAIERCRQELIYSEETTTTSNDRPVFEEFMPIKRHSTTDSDSNDNDHDHDDEEEEESDDPAMNVDRSGTKSDWLSSVQLWNNQTLSLDPSNKEDTDKKEVVEDMKTNAVVVSGTCKALNEDKKEKSPAKVETTVASSSAGTDSGESRKNDKVGQSGRKKRRCWSPELHRRFLNALHQLGGLHVATPKLIREFMKVDGLTNDEVKSHLQKYRMHPRKPSSNNGNNNINKQQQQHQTPQFVVVGGIWVHPPPTEYSRMNSLASTKSTSVYAPIALMPQAKHNCTSSNTSSTHTTTASPIF